MMTNPEDVRQTMRTRSKERTAMTEPTKREREEMALDALLVSVLRHVDTDDDEIDTKYLPELTDEEKAALNALPSDFVQRILAGERPLEARP